MFSWRGGWSRGSCHSPSKEVRCGGVRVGERDRGGRDSVIRACIAPCNLLWFRVPGEGERREEKGGKGRGGKGRGGRRKNRREQREHVEGEYQRTN